MDKCLFFQAEKRQQIWQNGQRNGLVHSFERLDKLIGVQQNHSPGPGISTGLVCMLSIIIILVHRLVTCLSYRDLVLHFL